MQRSDDRTASNTSLHHRASGLTVSTRDYIPYHSLRLPMLSRISQAIMGLITFLNESRAQLCADWSWLSLTLFLLVSVSDLRRLAGGADKKL